ncbi:hypothetical protein FBY40_0710 [Microbacterium sp. SLBN-154]|uniref:T3SS effector HopA1 family protein n=1 Tax=Microbacterium sp. SLBN-154 TaxID=2768458 RepID=UPI001152749F|nr:T3SS effector HopA1 family protein [Microbacterium sp. SLBN-154]TQK18223.1 hypothetical protein FBY40_0710 [Microbacterium sp. SLBN-154]
MTDRATPIRREWRLDPGVEALIEATTVAYRDDGWIVDCDGHELRASSQRGLEHALATHLYTRHHAGSTPQHADDFVPALQNDHVFEERLVAASASLSRVERLTAIDTVDGADGGAIVLLQGVRVFVPGTVRPGRGRVRIDAELPSLAPRLSIGFLFFTPRIGGGGGGRPLRVYRHLRNADEAVSVWARFTRWAEDSGAPLRAKVISQTWSFPRNDALVVYLPAESWALLDEVAEVLRADDETPVSIFARRIAPGVSVAWEPMDLAAGPGRTSFGEHRAAAVAQGVVASADGSSPTARVREALLAANVDPRAVFQNLDSPPWEWRVGRTGDSRQSGSGDAASVTTERKEQ